MTYKDANIVCEIDTSRITQNIKQAQFWLDTEVFKGMVPYMPMITGNFIQRTKAVNDSWAGTGKVCAGAGPMGRFLYEGKKMVDAITGKGPMKIEVSPGEFIFRFRKGAKLRPTTEPLTYTDTFHPAAQDHWFEPAKQAHLQQWVAGVKRIGGGGNG